MAEKTQEPVSPAPVTAPAPVAVGVRKVILPPLVRPIMRNRVSHAYFKRVSGILRAFGKRY